MMNRRHLFAAAPAFAAAALLPNGGVATAHAAQTQIAVLFAEWEEAVRVADHPTGVLPEAEVDAMIDRVTRLADQIADLPVQDEADLLMKFAAFTAYGIYDVSMDDRGERMWVELRDLLGRRAA